MHAHTHTHVHMYTHECIQTDIIHTHTYKCIYTHEINYRRRITLYCCCLLLPVLLSPPFSQGTSNHLSSLRGVALRPGVSGKEGRGSGLCEQAEMTCFGAGAELSPYRLVPLLPPLGEESWVDEIREEHELNHQP